MSREPDDDFEFTCWCGAKGTFSELYDDAVFDETCGGTGVLHCECGGDQCVCHHHGEIECPGCEDCAPDDAGDDDYYDED